MSAAEFIAATLPQAHLPPSQSPSLSLPLAPPLRSCLQYVTRTATD